MKTKDSMQIKVQTLPNGYALTVNGEEFMYFDPVTLLAGFMAHVGLGNSREMEKGSILSVLMSAMMGTAYSDAVETLKQRVAMLSGRYESMIERMDDAVKYVNSAHTQIETMRKTLEQQQNELLGYQQEVLKTKQNNEEMQKRQEVVMDMISNSSTLLKAFNETAAQKNRKEDGDEGACVPDWLRKAPANEEALEQEQHEEVEPPQDVVPACAVPEPGEEPHDGHVSHVTEGRASASAQRYVHIVAEE
jgi:cysteinyl-tRNA synthetase